jgi:outer membrane protein insertion porin family
MDDTGPFDGPQRGRRRGTALWAVLLGGVALLGSVVVPVAGQEPLPGGLPPAKPLDSRPPGAEEPAATLDQPLVDVKVEGNRTIAATAIAQHIKSRPGRPVSDRQITEDVQALYRTRWFISVEPHVGYTDAGPVLTFKVAERPIVRRVEYKGSKGIAIKHLAALTGIKPGSPYDPQTNLEAARRMREHYREKGYAFAEVTLAKGDKPEDREVIFDIKEGKVVRVRGFKFHGNTWSLNGYASDGYLKTKLQTDKMFWPLPFGGLYKPETIPNDVNNLKSYYFGLGFFDAQVRAETSFNEDKSRVTIDYFITEGTRYKVSGIRYEGNKIYSEKELAEDRALKPGEYFNERWLNKDVTRMQDMYGRLGRLYASVQPDPQYSEKPGETVLVYKIDESKPYVVRNINVNIRGDYPHTRVTLPLNISKVHPGDLADPKKIKKLQVQLGGSGYFEGNGGDAPSIEIQRVGFDEGLAEEDDSPLFRGQSDDGPAPDFEPQAAPPENPFAAPVQPTYRPENPFVEQSGGAPLAAPVQWNTAPCPVAGQADGYAPPVGRAPRASAARPPEIVQVAALAPQAPTASMPQPPPGPVAVASADPLDAPIQGPDFTDPRRNPIRPVQTADAVVNPYGDAGKVVPASVAQPNDYTPPFIPSDPQGNPLADYPQGQPPGFVDLNVNVTEARTGRFMVGAGVNSNSGVVGNIVLSEDNFDILRWPRSWTDFANGTAFRGRGQKFRIEAVPGNVVSRYLVSWVDPYFMDTDYSLGVSGFYFQRYYPSWNEERAGGRVNVGRQLTQNLSASAIFRGESVDVTNPAVPTPDLLKQAVGNNTLLTVGGALTWDNRDSPLLPSEGQFAEVTYTQGVADFVYPRVDLDGTQYFTVFSRPDGSGKHIVSVGGQLGFTGDNTPIFERYFAGGFQSFRGFQFRGVGPRQNGVNIGGQFLALGTVQYMFPLLANDSLHGVLFSDFGTVNDKVSLDNFRVTVGTGFRIAIPAFGPAPLAFDFAVPLTRTDGDQVQVFSFYVGLQR